MNCGKERSCRCKDHKGAPIAKKKRARTVLLLFGGNANDGISPKCSYSDYIHLFTKNGNIAKFNKCRFIQGE